MNISKKSFGYIVLASVVLIITVGSLLIFLPDYRISENDAGNRILTVKKGIGHFSLEIPSGFEVSSVEINDEFVGTDVYLVGPVPIDGYRSVIAIYIDDYGDAYDALSVAKKGLTDARDYTNFQLLSDLSTLTVSGITAYQYIISYDFPENPDIYPPPMVREIERKTYFNHDGFLWAIGILADPSWEEQEMAIFDRLLETFKILN
jgi:hypothetical protein